MNRPSHKELSGKIRQAEALVREGSTYVLSPLALAADAVDLDYSMGELPEVLGDLLEEILPDQYAGTSPPQRSYEEQIRDAELFPFRWNCVRFLALIYFKFTIRGHAFWLVSLHPDRREGGGRP
ncbi:MAG: hypothetical protein KKA60_15980 [Proteobacteria bacterium]|nr:hypothetical protein [Pseudomonadota bacterium]